MYVMQNKLMYVMQEQIDAYNVVMIFWGTWMVIQIILLD